MAPRRTRQMVALTIIGMALSACADGDGPGKAGAPEAGRAGSSGESSASSQPGDTAPGEARADLGPEVAATLGVADPSAPSEAPGAPIGHASATGGAPVAGGFAVPGGSPAGGTTTGGAVAPTQSGAADTGSASAAGSGSPRPKIPATPEDCAMLRQVMAIVDHPQLHQLKADTGC